MSFCFEFLLCLCLMGNVFALTMVVSPVRDHLRTLPSYSKVTVSSFISVSFFTVVFNCNSMFFVNVSNKTSVFVLFCCIFFWTNCCMACSAVDFSLTFLSFFYINFFLNSIYVLFFSVFVNATIKLLIESSTTTRSLSFSFPSSFRSSKHSLKFLWIYDWILKFLPLFFPVTINSPNKFGTFSSS